MLLDLFLLATGYKVGPQFFAASSRNALPHAALTLVLCVTSLLVAVAAAKVMHYDCGTAAGLLAGAFTESTVIGTAADMIQRLDLPPEEKNRLVNNIPVAYAVSYLVGTGFVVWFLSSLAPRLLRVDLKAEARKLEQEMAGGSEERPDMRSAYPEWERRAYRVTTAWFAGRTVGELEQSFAPDRVFVERIRRGDRLTAPAPETVLDAGDWVAVMARRHVHVDSAARLGTEVQDRELLDYPEAVLDVVVTNKRVAGHTLAELAEQHGRGIYLAKLVRGGREIPFGPATIVNRGDLLRIAGAAPDVERAAAALGYADRPSSETDMVFVGLGIVVGGLFGMLTLTVGNLPLSLTASGGALVMGLVFGWLRSVRPTFGRIPEPALWVFDTVGLTVFIGVVGLSAGPSFIAGLKQTGPSLLVVGFLVAVTPHVAALLFGRHVLKMNPLILLGACSGAGTVTAALRGIQDEAGSKLPVLGYTVPYAIGNILLTAWGPVIVVLTR